MTIQGFILGFVIAILLGALLHLITGGSLLRLGIYILLSLIGFWVGHIAATLMNWTFLKVGVIQLGGALIGEVIILGLGYWLSLEKTDEPKK